MKTGFKTLKTTVIYDVTNRTCCIDLFADTAAILISIVSNSYYGMPRGRIHINLPPEHPIMSFETIEIKMAAVSAKRSMVDWNDPGPEAGHLPSTFVPTAGYLTA